VLALLQKERKKERERERENETVGFGCLPTLNKVRVERYSTLERMQMKPFIVK
jgi:hypothetical protein